MPQSGRIDIHSFILICSFAAMGISLFYNMLPILYQPLTNSLSTKMRQYSKIIFIKLSNGLIIFVCIIRCTAGGNLSGKPQMKNQQDKFCRLISIKFLGVEVNPAKITLRNKAAGSGITCYTCHKGEAIPISTLQP